MLIDAGGYREQDWAKIQYLVTVDDLAGVERLYRALFVNVPWAFAHGRRGFLKAYTSKSVRTVLETTREEDTYDDGDLGRIRVPAAVVWGERDGIFPLATARAMAAALPQGSLRVLEGLRPRRPLGVPAGAGRGDPGVPARDGGAGRRRRRGGGELRRLPAPYTVRT